MTNRGIGTIAAVAALWVAARSFGVPELQATAVAALVLLVSAVAWARLLPTRLEFDRTVSPATLWFDGRANVVLRVRNTGRLPTVPLEVIDQAPTTIAQRSHARLPGLPPGGRATLTYELTGGQRGRFELGPVRVRSLDPFGLVERERTLPVVSTVTVYPPVWKLPAGLPLGGATGLASGGQRRASPSGEDLADIREYVQGDDLRGVHWPSTAHRGKLMVRRAEDVLTPRATVLLDVRASHHTGHGPTASLETAVAAAASTAYHLASRGRAVVVLDRPVLRPPIPQPWSAVLERLADIEVEDVDLPGLLRQVATGVTGGGTLVVVVTTPRDDELRTLVRAGRGSSSRIALVVDTASHAPGGDDPAADTAVAGLAAAGWRATVLRRGDRLDERWRELLGRGHRRPATTGAG